MRFRLNIIWCCMCFYLLGCGLDGKQKRFLAEAQSQQELNERVASGLLEEAQQAFEQREFQRAARLIERARLSNPNSRQLDGLAWQANALEFLASDGASNAQLTRLAVDRTESELRNVQFAPLMVLAQAIIDVEAGRSEEAKATLLTLTEISASEFKGYKARVFLELVAARLG